MLVTRPNDETTRQLSQHTWVTWQSIPEGEQDEEAYLTIYQSSAGPNSVSYTHLTLPTKA